MGGWQAVAEICRWEFHRYIKWKQQIVGMLLTFVVFGGFMVVARLGGDDEGPRDIAVIGYEVLPLRGVQNSSFNFLTRESQQEAHLRQQVQDGELAGLLIVRDADHAQLVLDGRVPWTGELLTLLTAARQQRKVAEAGLSAASLNNIMAAPTLDVTYSQRTAGHTRGERTMIVVVISLMLMAVFIGMSYIFTSVTAEKQIRVTEQVVSAIPAQAWIDGKILGLLAVSIVGVIAQVFAAIAVYLVLRIFFDSGPLPLPESLGDPLIIALLLLYAVLGLFFWFAFLAAIAATIDDPQHSARGALLFVPLFATIMAYTVIGDADSTSSRVIALVPGISPSAMPARLMTTQVSTLEIALSLVILIAAIMLLRIAAGRVFRLGMLMYGKEPSWSEVRRWVFTR
jgi:ABC-2 type transport system permease protein